MTAANKAKLEKLLAVFKNNEFTAKEAAETLSVSVSYARKFLNKMFSERAVERHERDNKYIYKLAHIESNDNEKEDSDSNEVNENVSNEYEIYFNGRRISSIHSTLNEVIDTVKGIYPDSQIEIDDNKIYITKRLGTKG